MEYSVVYSIFPVRVVHGKKSFKLHCLLCMYCTWSIPFHNALFTMHARGNYHCTFYPYDIVSAEYATVTWLGGWQAGCLSQPVLYQNN